MTTALTLLAALTLNAAQPAPAAAPEASEPATTVRRARAAYENTVEVARLEADARCTNRRQLSARRRQSTPRLQSVDVALVARPAASPLTVAHPVLPRAPTRIASLALHVE